ncbi:MerR family transcriptional regulator [Actinotalea sp. M2MS4P-6]|uniref:MerR family transcriptional regulator n=1 Tax=Actinotalea sp. M2MS4P-6 TaxID=2983762 RepID=UPI0021E40685|nr:MerR family transcriptional regulator [Actinotalea sp. M2MS4P-6]MCV2396058.1 MerR family transcriptional regulator [Actinotalea sp. M2MS4P-6]
MEASIQQVARIAGTTSRTLRHYDAIGLLPPTRIGHQGYRFYDRDALVRLQQILLLRELGLGLETIREVLDAADDPVPALRRHLSWLDAEAARLERLRTTVERTITTLEEGGDLMAEEMLDGFDHTRYKDEVVERWGKDAYATSDAWWRGMSEAERADWKTASTTLAADWTAAAQERVDPASERAQALAARHVAWLGSIPGTPGYGTAPVKEYVLGLGEMYVADPRFAKNYGGEQGAAFVRDALARYAELHL